MYDVAHSLPLGGAGRKFPSLRMRLKGISHTSLVLLESIVRMSKSRRLRLVGLTARMKESMSVFKMLTGKPIGKRHLGRLRHRWEGNIRIDVKEMGVNLSPVSSTWNQRAFMKVFE